MQKKPYEHVPWLRPSPNDPPSPVHGTVMKCCHVLYIILDIYHSFISDIQLFVIFYMYLPTASTLILNPFSVSQVSVENLR